ncbi:MAG TPA: Asd/ArgC dimerization domain-containing protein [Granulicella sp.]|jgi:aspartate-semialdehyde dehydrogenase|nr:Asd/ArgC dimerization domain-containing protein [Granulicella sp.]
MSNKIYRIAIVGASSLVGKELSDVLSESALGASSFTLLDEEQMAGSVAAAGDEISFIQKIDSSSFEGKDLVFFAGDAEVAAKYWKSAVSASASIVDLTGALEGKPGVLVRAPWTASGEERGDGAETRPTPDIATPAVVAAHPAAVMLALIARRLGARFGVRSLVATLLLPASEYGRAAMDELHQQTVSLLSFQSLPREQYDQQVAFNLVRGFGEAAKLMPIEATERRIQAHYDALCGEGAAALVLQVVHAPIFHGYGGSLLVELKDAATAGEVAEAIAGKHVSVAAGGPDSPNNVDAVGQEDLMVSVQAAGSQGEEATRFKLWVAADNLRLAAAHAVACAVELLQLRPSGEVQ